MISHELEPSDEERLALLLEEKYYGLVRAVSDEKVQEKEIDKMSWDLIFWCQDNQPQMVREYLFRIIELLNHHRSAVSRKLTTELMDNLNRIKKD